MKLKGCKVERSVHEHLRVAGPSGKFSPDSASRPPDSSLNC